MTAVKKGHPYSLYVLFFTEMWERFGYYLMIGIFFLYLVDPTSNGGKGFDNARAADIVGTYIALVYLTPFIGGLLADRYLGYRRSIIFGAILMAIGYFCLALPGLTTMYLSMACVIIGNGMFKPNISTLLGNIYSAEDLKPKKDSAYGIFYMGINIGAFFCNFVAAYLRHKYGWRAAFSAAGLEIQSIEMRTSDNYNAAFATATERRADALYINAHALHTKNRQLIADFALKSRLPSMYEERVFVVAGGLLSYAPSFIELFRRAATYVDKILKGAKPGDLPIEQPTKFELVINLETAKVLGLKIPPPLLQRADEVIQ